MTEGSSKECKVKEINSLARTSMTREPCEWDECCPGTRFATYYFPVPYIRFRPAGRGVRRGRYECKWRAKTRIGRGNCKRSDISLIRHGLRQAIINQGGDHLKYPFINIMYYLLAKGIISVLFISLSICTLESW